MIERLKGYDADPDALALALRDALRRNDLGAVLDACEGLLYQPCPFCKGGRKPSCIYEGLAICADCDGSGLMRVSIGLQNWLDEGWVDPVRAALRWCVDALPGRLVWDCEKSNACDCSVRPLHCVHHATRIANLARLLPNPQPMACSYCGEVSPLNAMFAQSRHLSGIVDCLHHGVHKATPAPTHALRLYVDAVRHAKGSEWFRWLCEAMRLGKAHHRITLYGMDEWYSIRCTGAVECTETCPPLPEVKT